MSLESEFKTQLIKDLKQLFPGIVITKPDAGSTQGIPDMILLYKNTWAALEVKRSLSASRRPNQEYYVNLMNDMSYSAFVCPENKEEILHALQQTFGA